MRYTFPHGFGLRFALLAALAVSFAPITVCAQSQSDTGQSVADAARKSREQKKKSQKPAKSLTDDDLQRLASAAAAAGETATAGSAQGQPPATESAPAPAEAAGQNAPSDAEVKELKEQLAQAQKDLDLLQREFALERDQFYSNPQYSRDSQGKAKLDSFEREIRDRQEQAERLKTRLAALQELQARTKGKQSGTNEKPVSPPQN